MYKLISQYLGIGYDPWTYLECNFQNVSNGLMFQSGRSNFTTAGFFLASPAAGRGAGGGVDILAEGRGIGFGLAATTGGVGVLGADVDAVDALDDAVAVFCSLARRFKRIFTNIQ